MQIKTLNCLRAHYSPVQTRLSWSGIKYKGLLQLAVDFTFAVKWNEFSFYFGVSCSSWSPAAFFKTDHTHTTCPVENWADRLTSGFGCCVIYSIQNIVGKDYAKMPLKNSSVKIRLNVLKNSACTLHRLCESLVVKAWLWQSAWNSSNT